MAFKPDFDPNDPQDFSANLAYLTEQVQAEPELYTIYKKDENGNYLRDENGQKIADEEADYTGTYRDIQWKNKTITELYYPGSVFRRVQRGKADLPLRRQKGARGPESGRGPAQQLQHLLCPAGPARGFQPVL